MSETTKLYDQTNSESGGIEELSFTPPSLERIEVQAERVTLKVGTFACDLKGNGRGSVTLDGLPVKCVRFTVEYDVRKVPRIVLEVLPLPSPLKPGGG
jgi:hypothetical protein